MAKTRALLRAIIGHTRFWVGSFSVLLAVLAAAPAHPNQGVSVRALPATPSITPSPTLCPGCPTWTPTNTPLPTATLPALPNLVGLYQVKDISPAAEGSAPANLVDNGGTLFFSAYERATGRELWRSDGTAQGTTLVKDLVAGPGDSSPSQLVVVDGTLYFKIYEAQGDHSELWRSDGTPEGTWLLRDLRPNADAGADSELVNLGGTLLFVAGDETTGLELWRSDGTSEGTRLVKDINLGAESSRPRRLTVMDGTLFFIAADAAGPDLWRSDGTAEGTVLVKDFPAGASLDALVAAGSTLFFTGGATLAPQLWRSDGTDAGTIPLASFRSAPQHMTSLGSTLYFWANMATTGPYPWWSSSELWKSDGTPQGTSRVLTQDFMYDIGAPRQLVAYNGRLYYVQHRNYYAGWGQYVNESNLYISDGTAAGTTVLKSFSGGAPNSFSGANGLLYFGAPSGYGVELWSSDGTNAGTVLLGDIAPGHASSNPSLVTTSGQRLYFTAADSSGRELWAAGRTHAPTSTPTNTPTPSSTPTPTRTRTPTRTATATITPCACPGLLKNPGMESDANGDGKPDSWTPGSFVTRSNAARHGGNYSMRHQASANSSYVVAQTVGQIVPRASYTVGGWTNIPATADTFSYTIEVLWRNAGNGVLRTDTVGSYSQATDGWTQALTTLVAPANSSNALLRMRVSGLSATIYADDFRFRAISLPAATATPTPTPLP